MTGPETTFRAASKSGGFGRISALWARAAAANCLLALAGCATVQARPSPAADARDCAVLMLAGGFIAAHQPPLRLRGATRDVEALLAGRARAETPESWSPDADAPTVAAIARARWERRAPVTIACPLDKSPFVAWRPGRAELVLSTPAFSPAGDFAVLDAAVLLPGRRIDHYRVLLSGPPKTGWDLHRIEFASAPLTGP